MYMNTPNKHVYDYKEKGKNSRVYICNMTKECVHRYSITQQSLNEFLLYDKGAHEHGQSDMLDEGGHGIHPRLLKT